MLNTPGRRLVIAMSAVLAACVMAVSFGPPARAGSGALPETLSTGAFWSLTAELSEPNGYFQSDNLVSNEIQFQRVIPDLTKVARPGRVYLGVGPEQNFTYIAALKPAMVFIVDVRRGNLQLHLMYKALFELSADRRGVRVAAVLEEAAGRAHGAIVGAGNLCGVREGRDQR